MLSRVSLAAIFVGTLILTGLAGVLGTWLVGPILGSIVALIIGGGVGAWFIFRIVKPLQELIQRSHLVESAVKGELVFPQLASPDKQVGRELNDLVGGLGGVMNSFQKRLTELDSLHAISQTITSSTLDYEKTVKSVLVAVQKVVDYDAAEVAILRGSSLEVEAWWGKDGFNDTTGRKYRIGKGPTGTIAETKAAVFMPTVKANEDLKRTIGYASAETEFIAKTTKLIINSFLGIPLLLGDRLIGTLSLVHHEAGFFSEDDKRQLNQLADHASIAIDNALQVRVREEALRRQIQELRIEIDEVKLISQVQEVVDTDYFKQLQASAAKMRERHQRTGKLDVSGLDDTLESRPNDTEELPRLDEDVKKSEESGQNSPNSDKN